MSAESTNLKQHQLTIDEEERAQLVRLLDQTLGETRVEAHHTHTPAFRDQVLHQEAVIRRLLEKVNRLVP